MPKRHGSFRLDEKSPVLCRLGILSVLKELRASPLRQIYPPAGKSPSPIQQTEFHFRYVVNCLLHSLDVFQSRLGDLKKLYNAKAIAGSNPYLIPLVQYEASIAACSVFHFLNLLVEDVGIIVRLVLRIKKQAGLYRLKKAVSKGKVPPRIKEVFAELDEQNSWWNIGFEGAKGIRQRLVHYTDVVQFQAFKSSKHRRFRIKSLLYAMDRSVPPRDLEAEISRLLQSLCEWLDRVEEALKDMLADEARKKGIQWNPGKDCPHERIPVGITTKWRKIPDKNFLYLPKCEGSYPFRSRIRIPTSPPKRRTT